MTTGLQLALAGGVNLYLHPSNYITLCGMNMLASDGRCKSFGERADELIDPAGL